MDGKVLTFDAKTAQGLISGSDGQRYSFQGSDIQSDFTSLSPGAQVDFEPDGGAAKSIFITSASSGASGDNTKLIAALLAFFLGTFGVHKFYLGKKKAGLIMLIVSIAGFILLAIPTLVMGLIAFIEFIIYLIKSEDDFRRDYIDGDKQWF